MNVLVGHRRRTSHPSGHRANEAHTGAHCVLEHIHSAMHCIACSEPFQRQQYRHSTGSYLSFTAVATAAAVPAAVIAEYYDMTGLVGKQKHTELVRLVWFDGPSYSICLFFRFVFFLVRCWIWRTATHRHCICRFAPFQNNKRYE